MKFSEVPQGQGYLIPGCDDVKSSFINTLVKIHRLDQAEAEAVYTRETAYFKQAVQTSEKLMSATPVSLYSVFLEIAINNLSIQPGGKSLAHIEPRSVKKKNGNTEVWETYAVFMVGPYGELEMRIRAGQIRRAYNPIVVYEGDTFQPKTNDKGMLIVDYAPKIPRQKNAKIIGCYVALMLPDGTMDFKWLLEEDIERLMRYSTPKETQYNKNPQANALYTSNGGQIDPGFLEAKTIKHAFRAYGKLRVSDSVAFESTEDEATPQQSGAPAPTFDGQPQQQTQQPEGVVITPGDDEPF